MFGEVVGTLALAMVLLIRFTLALVIVLALVMAGLLKLVVLMVLALVVLALLLAPDWRGLGAGGAFEGSSH